jgi:hypothetical protein
MRSILPMLGGMKVTHRARVAEPSYLKPRFCLPDIVANLLSQCVQ